MTGGARRWRRQLGGGGGGNGGGGGGDSFPLTFVHLFLSHKETFSYFKRVSRETEKETLKVRGSGAEGARGHTGCANRWRGEGEGAKTERWTLQGEEGEIPNFFQKHFP